jgi:hypothetical protein
VEFTCDNQYKTSCYATAMSSVARGFLSVFNLICYLVPLNRIASSHCTTSAFASSRAPSPRSGAIMLLLICWTKYPDLSRCATESVRELVHMKGWIRKVLNMREKREWLSCFHLFLRCASAHVIPARVTHRVLYECWHYFLILMNTLFTIDYVGTTCRMWQHS